MWVCCYRHWSEDEMWSIKSSLNKPSMIYHTQKHCTTVYNTMREDLSETYHTGNDFILFCDDCKVINRVSQFTLHNLPGICTVILCIWSVNTMCCWSLLLWYPCCANAWCLKLLTSVYFTSYEMVDTDGNNKLSTVAW